MNDFINYILIEKSVALTHVIHTHFIPLCLGFQEWSLWHVHLLYKEIEHKEIEHQGQMGDFLSHFLKLSLCVNESFSHKR